MQKQKHVFVLNVWSGSRKQIEFKIATTKREFFACNQIRNKEKIKFLFSWPKNENKWSTYFEDGNLRARAQAGNPIKRPCTDFGFTQYAWTSAAAEKQFGVHINRATIHWATFSPGHPALSVYSGSLFLFHRHAKWLLFPVRDRR